MSWTWLTVLVVLMATSSLCQHGHPKPTHPSPPHHSSKSHVRFGRFNVCTFFVSQFLPRDDMHKRCLCRHAVYLSVCLTFVSCGVKTRGCSKWGGGPPVKFLAPCAPPPHFRGIRTESLLCFSSLMPSCFVTF